MSADVTEYLDLITSEHRNREKFIATVTALVQGPADGKDVITSIVTKINLDAAVGAQLDIVGEWVGRSRYLTLPLEGVYFSFDTADVGFDEGTWLGPFDPVTGLTALPDDSYRTLLRAVIAANQWDGSIPQAYAAWETLFAGTGSFIIIQDLQDMSFIFGLLGPAPNAVTYALLVGGYLALKPAGVRIAAYVLPTVPSTPLFGFDVESDAIAGFDTGSFGEFIEP